MANAIGTILVPVDGSEHASAAARYGERLALAIGARMELLHVFEDTPGMLMQRMGYTGGQAVADRVSIEAFDRMREESARLAFQQTRVALQGGVEVIDRVLSGDPADAVAHYAHGVDAPVIVMGRRGVGEIWELLVGSVTEGVIHRTEYPVTVVTYGAEQQADAGGGSVLVVPVDDSEQSLVAARHANTVAKATGASVHLLHVFPGSPQEIYAGSGERAGELQEADAFSDERFKEVARTSADKAFARARAQFDVDAVALEEVRRPGKPAQVIISYARATPGAEVIMARHGHGRIREFLLGSISQRVLHAAHCPVTVVH
ncbi:universal stress protein [Aquisalimonas sp.]|uniref:universal stress protein n=1 Tax=unclassified Aquisalimonas TaxID=2644645 RepID=UPI0025C37D9E|nr:universal stress protein [Aquisalimonas sp.]